MRNIKQLCVAAVLTLVITIPTFAGVIQTPGDTVNGVTPPPDATATGEMQTPGVNAAGDMQFPGATTDPLTEMALGFLLNLSSLL
jgi:hypothetical protein